MAESEAKILVSLGREKYTVPHTEGMTFGDVRAQVVSLSALDSASFRFLCKGRAAKDEDKVSSGAPPPTVKIMALKTKKGYESSASPAKAGTSSIHLSSVLEAAKEKEKKKLAMAKVQAVQPTEPKGDMIAENEPFVMVRLTRERYHVRIELSSSVFDLKKRLETMEGIPSKARDMNLIFGGRQRKDEEILQDIGVKRGSMLLLLFLARHHDSVEALGDLMEIKERLKNLQRKAIGLGLQFGRRLMDTAEVRARIGELEDEACALKNQLTSNKCEHDERKGVQKSMENVESAILAVREKLNNAE